MRGLVRPEMANNPNILSWWTSAHDDVLRQAIKQSLWYWHFYVRDGILAITDSAIIDKWKKNDPACQRGVGTGAWYNVLEYFAYARAQQVGLSKYLRPPKWKTCPLCKNRFLENSLPEPLAKRLGFQRLDYCSPCLAKRLLQNTGSDRLSADEVKSYLARLSSILQAIPHQGFGEGPEDLLYLEMKQRLSVLHLLADKPSTRHVKKLFTSWLRALIDANVLDNGTRKTGRGTMCVAKDGHTCYSLAEKTIDDFLHDHGIRHTKEPSYPQSNYRADFEIKGCFIEYFGLAGDTSYNQRIQAKQALAKDAGINLIAIYPKDLINRDWLARTLLSI